MLNSRICELPGIEYPVFQGGMARIADGVLAAAVSEGGGLGIIAAGNDCGEDVRREIRIAKEKTDRPIGVNIMLLSPYADEVAKVVVEEKVSVVTTGAGNPSKYMESRKEAGIKVIPVVASVALAKRMAKYGASALIAEGAVRFGPVPSATIVISKQMSFSISRFNSGHSTNPISILLLVWLLVPVVPFWESILCMIKF